jgi:4-diphosphocytidyl-2-C-methyl-D-erythritol kinase
VGERLTPVSLPPRWYVVIYPGVGVSTRQVFQNAKLTRNSPLITIRAFFESGGRNDCEGVVRALAPGVSEALEWLARRTPAHLSGTGSCVFAAYERAADAERVAAQVPDCWMSFVARGLDTSPVHERLEHGRRT